MPTLLLEKNNQAFDAVKNSVNQQLDNIMNMNSITSGVTPADKDDDDENAQGKYNIQDDPLDTDEEDQILGKK